MGSGNMFPLCTMGRPDCVGAKRHEIQEQNGIIDGLGGAGVGGGYWGTGSGFSLKTSMGSNYGN